MPSQDIDELRQFLQVVDTENEYKLKKIDSERYELTKRHGMVDHIVIRYLMENFIVDNPIDSQAPRLTFCEKAFNPG